MEALEHPSAEALVTTLCRLVRIDSPSGSEQAIAEELARELAGLGLEVVRDESGNVIGRLDGTGNPLALAAHMDSVPPCIGIEPVVVDGFVRSAGKTILGADDKAGLSAILELVRSLVHGDEPHRPIDVLFTVGEEVGMTGAKAVDLSCLRASEGVCLDASGAASSLVIGSPWHWRVDMRFEGRAAHAGVAPESGINAIQVAAKAVSEMTLGRLDHETTANVGVIHGGHAHNVVPEAVALEAEVRSLQPAKLHAQMQAMTDAAEQAANIPGAKVNIETVQLYPGYHHALELPAIQRVMGAMKAAGVNPNPVIRGGGSDANILTGRGLTLINLGVGYRFHHGTEEELEISELCNCLDILKELARPERCGTGVETMRATDLETPCLVVDLDILERNIERMQFLLARNGIACRPHVKTHKIPAIAHLQMDAGAIGITCQKLSEAEVMINAGIRDVPAAIQHHRRHQAAPPDPARATGPDHGSRGFLRYRWRPCIRGGRGRDHALGHGRVRYRSATRRRADARGGRRSCRPHRLFRFP